jgi:hypothetical protein
MQRLAVRHACIAAIAIDMINFNPIIIDLLEVITIHGMLCLP